MNLFLFISKIRINIFSTKDHAKNTDNVFVYIFNKNLCKFAQVQWPASTFFWMLDVGMDAHIQHPKKKTSFTSFKLIRLELK